MNKKGLITIGTLLMLLLAAPFAGTAVISLQTADQIHENLETIPQKELGLVLGAAAYGDRLSAVLQDRVDTAIDLYEAEKVSVLIMSGAPNEVEAMEKYAISEGVPAEALVQDISGLNTMASVKNVAELDRSVIIISQRFHLPRALFIANTLDLDALGLSADRNQYADIFDFKKREIFALSKAIFDLYLLD